MSENFRNCSKLNDIARQACFTLVNVYVALSVFTPVAGSSYAHFMEQNGGVQYVNSEFGIFIFVGVNTI